MDEKLRDSLMEWYLQYGEREVHWRGIMHDKLHLAVYSQYVRLYHGLIKITPEGIEALKNG